MQPTIIAVLGKPLSGKDTVANMLRDTYSGLATISMGDVVREVKNTGPTHRFWTELEDSIAIADAGGIAPDEPVFRCITQLIDEQIQAGKDTVMWVGGPRSLLQLAWLDEWTAERGFREQFLALSVPDAEVYHRLNGRADGRADDRADVIAVRLREFERVTMPVIEQLRRDGRIREINGVGSREVVGYRAVEALMGGLRDPEISLPRASRR